MGFFAGFRECRPDCYDDAYAELASRPISWEAGRLLAPGGVLERAYRSLTRLGVADEWISPTKRVSERSFALQVCGDPMEPEFTEGATIIVDPERGALHGSFVVVKLEDAQEATFKQLIVDAGQKFLRPLNAHYPVMAINGNATIVGVVVAKMKTY